MNLNTFCKLTVLLLWLGVLGACGGGSSAPDADVSQPETATVGLILTDASADDYDHAFTTITSVELLGNGGQLIFSGEQEVDLLSLKDTVKLFAVNEDVTPGDYTKIRLQATGLTLVAYNADGTTTTTYAELVANGKIDLNPRGPFSISAGDVVFISFDWDVNESLKLTETGNGKVNMRPVVFVDVGSRPAFKEGLVRVHGIVDLIAKNFSAFRICSPDVTTQLPSTPVLNSLCLDIIATDKTGLFDEKGLPIIVSDLMQGDPVTVFGLLRRSADGPVVTPLSDDNGDVAPTPFQVVAVVVEGGMPDTWSRVRGTLKSIVDDKTSAFGFLVDVGQGFPIDTVLTGQLYDTTRIFRLSRDAGMREISPAELMVEDRAIVDSVYIPPDADQGTLRIAMMLSRMPLDTISIRGEIASVDVPGGTLQLSTLSGDRCVSTDMDTKIYEVFVNQDSVESVPAILADLTIGSMAGATGTDDAGCLAADIIIAEGQSVAP